MIIMDKRQDKNAEDPLVWLGIITVPGVQGKARRYGMETEKNKNKSGSCDDPQAQIDI